MTRPQRQQHAEVTFDPLSEQEADEEEAEADPLHATNEMEFCDP